MVDIETDKVVLEVVAPADGAVAEIIRGVGDVVTSEELLARFKVSVVTSSEQETKPNKEASTPGSETVNDGEAVYPSASPSARKLAKESGIPLSSIEGSGKVDSSQKTMCFVVADAQDIGQRASESAASTRVEPGTFLETEADRIERRVPMT